MLQLMVNLAYKPTFTTMDDNPLPLLPLVVVSPEESFNWGAYLKEGWEKFQLPDDVSYCTSTNKLNILSFFISYILVYVELGNYLPIYE